MGPEVCPANDCLEMSKHSESCENFPSDSATCSLEELENMLAVVYRLAMVYARVANKRDF